MCAVLAMVMMLSSCATVGSIGLKKLLDASQYADDKAYAKAEMINGLGNATLEGSANQLLLFSENVVVNGIAGKKYVVYDVNANKTVYEATSSPTSSFKVSLIEAADGACFTVAHSTWSLDASNVKIGRDTVNTMLYGADGAKIAETYRDVTAETAYDLVRFDGKCYRMGEGSALAYAFDYSDLRSMPTVLYATEKLYFCEVGDEYMVCDDELEVKSYLKIPSYAEIGELVTLNENNLLIQYSVELEANAEKYDYVAEKTSNVAVGGTTVSGSEGLAKYDLYTVVFNGKTGKTKEVKFNYSIDSVANRLEDSEDWVEDYGLSDKYDNIVVLAPIEDKRINDSDSARFLATLDSNGGIKQLKDATEVPTYATLPRMVSANRWVMYSVDNREFVVDEKGKVLGEITKASFRDTYIYGNGKMYDYDLNVIYDYAKDNLAVEYALGQAMLFRNLDNELICYSSSKTEKLIAKDAKRSLYHADNEYFIIMDYSDTAKIKFEIYNESGAQIYVLSAPSAWAAIAVTDLINVVYTDGEYMVVRAAVDVQTAGGYKYEYLRFARG